MCDVQNDKTGTQVFFALGLLWQWAPFSFFLYDGIVQVNKTRNEYGVRRGAKKGMHSVSGTNMRPVDLSSTWKENTKQEHTKTHRNKRRRNNHRIVETRSRSNKPDSK
jgi:hypothetical protein